MAYLNVSTNICSCMTVSAQTSGVFTSFSLCWDLQEFWSPAWKPHFLPKAGREPSGCEEYDLGLPPSAVWSYITCLNPLSLMFLTFGGSNTYLPTSEEMSVVYKNQ